MSANISVIGDGGWGTTLAVLLSRKGEHVTLWSVSPKYAEFLDSRRVNPNFLKGISIPRSVRITSSLKTACSCDLLVLAAPSQYLRGVLRRAASYYDARIPVVSVAKGIENRTLMRMSEVIASVWRTKRIGVLSGPTIALEVAKCVPTTAVVSSHDRRFMEELQDLFMTPFFRVYTNSDVVGVELGGSFKNIIAIACGISDGLRFGTNTKAAILSRGLAEMARLGVSLGGKRETFFGLSGLGDLATTCFNPLSRNRLIGEQMGRGRALVDIIRSMKMVAEGVATTKSVYALGKKAGVELPIVNEIYRVLFKGRRAGEAVSNLMMRDKKEEAA